VFIDLKKAYDRVSREVLWECLEKKEVSMAHIQVIKEVYEGVRTRFKTLGGDTKDFPIKTGLH